MVRVALCSLIVLLVGAEFSFAQDNSKLTDAAYCTGAIARNIDLAKKDFGSPNVGDPQLLERFKATVEGGFQRRQIDIETANKLVRVGAEDAQICWDNSSRCSAEATKRAEDPKQDYEKSAAIDANCHRRAEAVCKRIEICQ